MDLSDNKLRTDRFKFQTCNLFLLFSKCQAAASTTLLICAIALSMTIYISLVLQCRCTDGDWAVSKA